VLHVRPGVKQSSINSQAALEAGIRDGRVLLPSAATRALLVKVAGNVAYGQTTPVTFPFRLTGPLPAGWRLTQASFTASGGRLAGTGITVGPAADPAALGVGHGPGSCSFFNGQSSYVTRLGVQWVYRVLSETDKQWQDLCTIGAVNGVTGVSVSIDMNAPARMPRCRAVRNSAAPWACSPGCVSLARTRPPGPRPRWASHGADRVAHGCAA
jgi:hypothetical protein